MTATPDLLERGAPDGPRRILVVDDDEDILLMIMRLLTARGYACVGKLVETIHAVEELG